METWYFTFSRMKLVLLWKQTSIERRMFMEYVNTGLLIVLCGMGIYIIKKLHAFEDEINHIESSKGISHYRLL